MTPNAFHAVLPHRGVVRVNGLDAGAFLQGLISNDIHKATAETGVYATLLTPQGKFLHDMFILADGPGAYLIDCEQARAEDLLRRLTAYKLRARVEMEDVRTSWAIVAGWGNSPNRPGRSYADPRLPDLGWRSFVPADVTAPDTVSPADYDNLRFALGVPDGSRDLEIEKSTLADGNLDHLNAVDWKKGCYVGQELTARMHYRGLAKKRLFPIRIQGQIADASTLFVSGREVGALRSHVAQAGLAFLAIDVFMNGSVPLQAGAATVTARWPGWLPRGESNS